jgi:cyclophilin family peptidyl-prolyl cis-trans isomerase
VKGFLVQFGITYNKNLKNQPHIPDDPQKDPPIPFDTGIISFAGSGPNSRTSQLFIAYGPNRGLGRELWETPLGRVIEGMDHVEAFYSYGDMPPWGEGPVQGRIHNGPQYIENNFPLTDKFDTCQVERLGKDIKAEDYAKAEHERQGLAKELPSKLRASRESDTSDEGIFGLIPMPLAQAIGFILLILAVIKLLLPSRKVLNKSS